MMPVCEPTWSDNRGTTVDSGFGVAVSKFVAPHVAMEFSIGDQKWYEYEAFFAGDKRHVGLLKTIITGETMMIERKGIDAAQHRNFIGMIMASNMRFVVPAGQDARPSSPRRAVRPGRPAADCGARALVPARGA